MHISTKCSVAVHCLLFIHEYGETKRVTSELLALSAGSNPVTVRTILSALKKDGILRVRCGTGGAAIRCPLREITLYRVFRAVDPDFLSRLIGVHAGPSPLCPVGRSIHAVLDASYNKVREDVCASLKEITMEDIAANYHRFREGL